MSSNRGAHVNQLSNRPQRITTRQVDPSSYISNPTSAAGGHSRLGWLTRDQHSHSIEVIAFQKLVLGSTALHFLPSEFVVACKFRLGLPVYDQPGPCPSCGKDSDILGDHSMVCGTGGERIAMHNAVRDALHDTAAAAGLAPLKEGRALLPGNNRGADGCVSPSLGWRA